jgi:hypothetical protein
MPSLRQWIRYRRERRANPPRPQQGARRAGAERRPGDRLHGGRQGQQVQERHLRDSRRLDRRARAD